MKNILIILGYYAIIALSAIFAGLSQKYEGKKVGKIYGKIVTLDKILWIISFMILLIVIGFRTYGVGIDDENYRNIFYDVSANGVFTKFFNSGLEPGYLLLNYTISLFTDNFQVVIFFTTLIPLILYYKALEYEKDNINLFLAVFIFGSVLGLYFLRYNKVIYSK